MQNLHDALDDRLPVELKPRPKHFLRLPAAYCEKPMRRDRRNRLGKVVVLLEFRWLRGARRDDFALHHGLGGERLPDCAAHVGDVRNALGHDVAGELQVLLVGRTAAGRLRSVREPALPYRVGQRLVALLLRHLRTRAALRLVRLVEVFEARLHKALLDLAAQIVSQLALLVDGLQYRLLALFKLAVIPKPVADLPDLDLVEVPVHFLAIARHEGNGAAIRQQLAHGRDLRLAYAHFSCNSFVDSHSGYYIKIPSCTASMICGIISPLFGKRGCGAIG